MLYKLSNYFLAKTHVVRTGAKRGEWMEWDQRMFNACFNILVDYIETDLIGMDVQGTTKRRDPVAGIRALEWQMALRQDADFYDNDPEEIARAKSKNQFNTPTPQALAAQKQYELYTWYKDVYPRLLARCNSVEGTVEDYDLLEQEQDRNFKELTSIYKTLWC